MTQHKSINLATIVFAIGLSYIFIVSLRVQSIDAVEDGNEYLLSLSTFHRMMRDQNQGETIRYKHEHLRQLSIIVENNNNISVQSDADTRTKEYSTFTHTFDPNSYAYLIIHYHKTGHHLSRQLRDFIVAGNPGGPKSNDRENAFLHRMHEEETGCPHAMELSPGIITVQAAPNLFCDTNVLAEYLLRNTNDNKPLQQQKKGVKVIHLVRNPFDLAVSNWIYHAQYPTPELWVKTVDPCTEELWYDHQSLSDLVRSTLLLGEQPVMTLGDFDALHNVCTETYQVDKESKAWRYYTHLRQLDPRPALSLATTHMMIQGKSGGDILRMASNVMKLNQLQRLEDQIRISQHLVPAKNQEERMIQVMTLSMKEFTDRPKQATLRFLDFALGNASPAEVKERIATDYESAYLEKIKGGDEHITKDKEILNGKKQNIVGMKDGLEKFLRNHELFGRVLGNVEQLVNEALRESSSDI